MNYRLFFTYNIIGASLWAVGVTFLGYFVGANIPGAEKYLTPIVLVIIAVTMIPLFITWWRREKIPRVKSCPRVVVFDIDDTLTESFKPPHPEMLEKLKRLLALRPIAIMSAAGFARVEDEFLPFLSASPYIQHLYIFPNSTSECYMLQSGEWKRMYDNGLTQEDRDKIKRAIEESVEETGVLKNVTPEGQQMIDRGTQIAFAALGLEASDEVKKAWDVDKTKRTILREALLKRIPDYEILIGGRTTIDITRKGINKSHGVHWLAERLNMKPKEMLYIGDALYPGGNDSVVIPTGIQTVSTSGPKETLEIIDDLLATCRA